MESSKPAYFIFKVLPHDMQKMRPYQEKVSDTYKLYGGELLVLNNEINTVEGEDLHGMIVILQFPDINKARDWYTSPEYQNILPHRQAGSTASGWLIEGVFKN